MELVYLAHGVVEDAGDDAAVAVAGGSAVALAEAEAADEGLAGFVENEFKVHAFGVIRAADEAVVLLHFDVAGVVALGLGWHRRILTCEGEVCFDCGCASRPRSTTSAQDNWGRGKVLLLTLGGILYTYQFWKSLDWSPS